MKTLIVVESQTEMAAVRIATTAQGDGKYLVLSTDGRLRSAEWMGSGLVWTASSADWLKNLKAIQEPIGTVVIATSCTFRGALIGMHARDDAAQLLRGEGKPDAPLVFKRMRLRGLAREEVIEALDQADENFHEKAMECAQLMGYKPSETSDSAS